MALLSAEDIDERTEYMADLFGIALNRLHNEVYRVWREALIDYKRHGIYNGTPFKANLTPQQCSQLAEEVQIAHKRLRMVEKCHPKCMAYCYWRYHCHEQPLTPRELHALRDALYKEACIECANSSITEESPVKEQTDIRIKTAENKLNEAVNNHIITHVDRRQTFKQFCDIIARQAYYETLKKAFYVVKQFEEYFIASMPLIWEVELELHPRSTHTQLFDHRYESPTDK
jgi:hypothetical protein